jgi:hypothetical protein
MIDVMDKHFQESLHLSLAQSAWVQFAHCDFFGSEWQSAESNLS